MKKETFRFVSIGLILLLLLSAGTLFAGGDKEKGKEATGTTAVRTGKYAEAPELTALVKAGKLPPVDERLPENPMVVKPIESIGIYGGTWKMIIDGQDRVNNVAQFTDIGLLMWNRTQDASIPGIAAGWDVLNDGREFAIKLRKGHKWSDGQPFTADDVMFWWEDIFMNDELMPVKHSYFKSANGDLATLERIDDVTVKYTFTQPHGMFILFLTKLMETYAPKHYLSQFHPRYTDKAELEKKAKDAGFENWVGLFNFKWEVDNTGENAVNGMNNPDLPTLYAWIPTVQPPAERFVFKRNPYFFAVDTEGKQLPYIDEVDLRVADPEVMNMKIIAGEPNFQASRPQAFKDMPLYMQYAEENEYNVFQWGDLQISECAIWINQNTPDPVDQKLFQTRDFRIALSIAINREKINQTLYSGMGKPTTATLPPVEARYYKEEYARKYTEYDSKKANQMLDQVGLTKRDGQGFRLKPDGKRLTLVVEPPDNRLGMIDNLHMIVDDWKDIGVELIVKPVGTSLWNKRMRGGLMQLTGWPMGKAASETDLVPINTGSDWAPLWGLWYNTKGKSGVEPPQHIKDLQNVWSEILLTVDEKKKDELYAKILQANADNVWVIGVVGPVPKPIIAKKWLHNVNPNGVWSFHHGHFVGNTKPYQFWIEKDKQ